MTDYENKNLTGEPQPVPQAEDAPKTETAQTEAVHEAPAAEKVTPQLTLEPDPVVPETVFPADPAASSAQAFHMPEPPRAPEPQPAASQEPTPPNYTAQYQQSYQQPYQPPQQPQYYKQYFNTPPAGYLQKSRLAAGLLAILFGALGIHNFYLGFTTRGVIQLVVCIPGILLCGLGPIAAFIWGFVEGVQLLTANSPSRLYDANGVILRD